MSFRSFFSIRSACRFVLVFDPVVTPDVPVAQRVGGVVGAGANLGAEEVVAVDVGRDAALVGAADVPGDLIAGGGALGREREDRAVGVVGGFRASGRSSVEEGKK